MAEVWRANPEDADVGTLYAESLMDLQPWDLWTKDGQPKGRALEIVALLEEVLAKAPEHPGALHLYIHATEASAHPDRAITVADRLRGLVPASGHLVHMPSHIDVLTGRWELAAVQNEKAIEADRRYRKKSPKQGFYSIYMAHNHHMLAFASMMEGRGEVAIRAARHVVADVPSDYGREQAALIDPYMAIPYETLTRFGRWDDMLKEPAPASYWPITTALWRFCRGVAYAAKGDIAGAEAEQTAFREAAAKVPHDALMAVSPAKTVLRTAEHMLAGELAYRQGRMDDACAELHEAVKAENELLYMEPPEWILPVRHALGAVLIETGRHAEAEQVYRDDLKKWPNNGWSLYGLAACLEARGATAEAAEVERQFEKAWARADTKIGSSCLCVHRQAVATGG
jgi:tetratricopeptide (TPR) repeat protein